MQRVLYLNQLAEVEEYVDKAVIDYINEGQIESFESFSDFDFIAFDWYDTDTIDRVTSQILIYIDADDIFFFCEDKVSFDKANSIFKPAGTNERVLYDFFTKLLKNDMAKLESLETIINDMDLGLIKNKKHDYIKIITDYRRILLDLKLYYQQLNSIFEYLVDNDNDLLSKESQRYFSSLEKRTDRFLASVTSLRDCVAQMREAYQAQIDIEQNSLMKIFTVVTSIFLPLTLLVGWYGMNFDMPEFHWSYGYPAVIAASAVISILMILYFKKKKWF